MYVAEVNEVGVVVELRVGVTQRDGTRRQQQKMGSHLTV